jgi:hypothetical protein
MLSEISQTQKDIFSHMWNLNFKKIRKYKGEYWARIMEPSRKRRK